MRVLGAIAMLVAGFLYFSSYNPAYQTAPNLPQQVAKKYEQSRVPITEEAVIRNLQQNSAIDFLRQLKNLNPDSDKEILKSQCRAYLVGYSEFPQQELSWGGFIHELYSACMGNEIASEIVASAIKGQKMIGVNELILVQDIRPTEIDSASENQCYWQAQLFINSIEIIFPAAVSDSREDIVLPYLDDPSNKVSLIAFMALNPKFDGKSYSSISEFIATLDSNAQLDFAMHIAQNTEPNSAVKLLREIVNEKKLLILPAFCTVAAKSPAAIELALNGEFDLFTSEQASIVQAALNQPNETQIRSALFKEGLLRHQLLNSYYSAGITKRSHPLNLQVVEWIARLDNNPIIKRQAINFLATINQENSSETAKLLECEFSGQLPLFGQ